MQSDQDIALVMTRRAFIESLYKAFFNGQEDCISYGIRKGWLEFEDELYSDEPVLRKNEARILHLFLLKELGIKDLQDIQKAGELRDLYDCRVCANHVAQVYLRGIMDAGDIAVKGGFLWFGLEGEDDVTRINEHIRRLQELSDRLVN